MPKTCLDIFKKGNRESRQYIIKPDNGTAFAVFCDMDTDGGGWTVFQRRKDGTVNFYRNWLAYKTGFGHLSGNFWLGLEKIHRLTNAIQGAMLRVDLRHWNGKNGYAKYHLFRVSDEHHKYRLTVGVYSGNANDSLSTHNEMYFTTFDQDNDKASTYDCAANYGGAWWYKSCFSGGSNLNAAYPTAIGTSNAYKTFMTWLNFQTKGSYGNVIFSEMKLR